MSYPLPPGGVYPPPPPGYPPPGYPPPGYPPGHPPPGYPPPGYPPPGYGASHRATSPKVFGILSICLGAVGALFSGLIAMAGIIATSERGARTRPEDAPLIAIFLTVAVWSALLIGVGIGQVRYRHWSLSATWVWSVSGILVAVASVVGFVMVVPESEPALGFAIMAAFLLPYPVTMMIFFSRPAVKESLEA